MKASKRGDFIKRSISRLVTSGFASCPESARARRESSGAVRQRK
ncbi:MAG: hypothetical protein RIS92_1111 [Verrucomicrobiota bacterium]